MKIDTGNKNFEEWKKRTIINIKNILTETGGITGEALQVVLNSAYIHGQLYAMQNEISSLVEGRQTLENIKRL